MAKKTVRKPDKIVHYRTYSVPKSVPSGPKGNWHYFSTPTPKTETWKRKRWEES